jgi:predicted short-subunit dehydrogenase-like oxidoreductase (DUF2520 family)
MRIIIAGPGRAGLSLAWAASAAGHDIVGVVGKDEEQAAAAGEHLSTRPFTVDATLPEAELLIIATRDSAIATVAARLAGSAGRVAAAVHVSGLTKTDALAPLAAAGLQIGSFHPLQTLPTPEAGAARIAGAWIAVTATEPLRTTLHELAASLGAEPFDLADDVKALYHAGAAAAANFPLAALTMASDLLTAAGVPFVAAEPLVRAVIDNAFTMGPRPSLTGPVARGDVATVRGQLDAVAHDAPEWVDTFSVFVLHLAAIAGRRHDFEEMLMRWQPPTEDDP